MKKTESLEIRDAIIGTLLELARADKNIILISNDFGSPSLDFFRKELPDQFINAGISEQNIISVSAGLSLRKKRVYIYSIASFITLRCLEQIKIDLCLMALPVTIIGVGVGYGYGHDGPTHHSTEDISILSVLPNITLLSPSDAILASELIRKNQDIQSPVFIRTERGKLPVLSSLNNVKIYPQFRILKHGKDVCIIATGFMVHRALEICDQLQTFSIKATVIDIFQITPLNVLDLKKIISNYTYIVTLEEHVLRGGLGSIITEIIIDNELDIKVMRMGLHDNEVFAYGDREDLHCKMSLDTSFLTNRIFNWMTKGFKG